MAFTGDHHDVARLSRDDRLFNRAPPVEFNGIVTVCPDLDLCRDCLRVFAAWIVGRNDHAIGQCTCDASHLRSLAAVTITTAAEDDDHAPRGEGPHGTQHVVERVRRVRVVDDHAEGLVRGDDLEPSGHTREPGTSRRNRLEWHAGQAGSARRREGVFDVETADEPSCELAGAPRRAQAKGGAARAVPDVLCPHVRVGGIDAEAHVSRQPYAVRVIGVARRGAAHVEQQRLGGEVRLHVAVVIQMVLRQIREGRRGEAHAANTMLIQGVRRDLHRTCRVACVDHAPKISVEINRLRRGALRGFDDATDAALDCPQQARRMPRGRQDCVLEVRRRGLAIRARDRQHEQLSARLSEKQVGDRPHRRSTRVDHDLRDGDVQFAFDHERAGACRDRCARMVVAVRRLPRHAEEERPVLHATRVVREVANVDAIDGKRRCPRVNGTEEVREQHLTESSPRSGGHLASDSAS